MATSIETINATLATRAWVRNQNKRRLQPLVQDEIEKHVAREYDFLSANEQKYVVEFSQGLR